MTTVSRQTDEYDDQVGVYWQRIEGRIFVSLYEVYSREAHSTDWMGPASEFMTDFEAWLWDMLSGDLTDQQVDDVPYLMKVYKGMEQLNEERKSKLLSGSTTARTRRRRSRLRLQ